MQKKGTAIEKKIVVYQVVQPVYLGIKNTNNKPWGTIEVKMGR
jgi:hypothetical protein